LGYRWQAASLELEWLNLSSITYTNLNASVGTPATTAQLSGQVKGQALMAGVNYEFYKFYNYIPYVNLAIGLTSNKASMSINNGPIQALNSYLLSGGLGLGIKFNIYSRFYADAIVRGLFLGQSKYDGSIIQPGLKIRGRRIWLGASLRIIWLF
jgi:hypothetical protein